MHPGKHFLLKNLHAAHGELYELDDEEEEAEATAAAAEGAVPLVLDEGSASLALARVEADPFAWGGPPVRWASRDQPGSVVLEINDGAEASELQKFQQGMELVTRSLDNAREVLRNVLVPTQTVSLQFRKVSAEFCCSFF